MNGEKRKIFEVGVFSQSVFYGRNLNRINVHRRIRDGEKSEVSFIDNVVEYVIFITDGFPIYCYFD